jgi:Double zinc ribbon/Phospholipase_D-nuclease N-terminal
MLTTFTPALLIPALGVPELMVLLIPGLIILTAYVALACYIYGDARRRGMPHVMWTLLAIFIPSGIGIILYFILRQPLLIYCSQCGASMQLGLAYCPQCGRGLAPACPQCRRVSQPGWTHCGWCGSKL